MNGTLTRAPDTGDVLLTRGHSMFNRISCRLTGPAAHQATFYSFMEIVEASKQTGRVVKRKREDVFDDLQRDQSEWIVYHFKVPPMAPALRVGIQCDLMEACEFERYSSVELPLQALDVLWNNVVLRRQMRGYDVAVFRRLGDIWDNGVICSKTSNRVLIRNGLVPTDSGLEYGSPSDTYRYLKSCSNVEVIGVSHGWYKQHGA